MRSEHGRRRVPNIEIEWIEAEAEMQLWVAIPAAATNVLYPWVIA